MTVHEFIHRIRILSIILNNIKDGHRTNQKKTTMKKPMFYYLRGTKRERKKVPQKII